MVLCAITIFSVGAGSGDVDAGLGVAVLGAAFFKVHLVMHYFMELDDAPLSWRLAFGGWAISAFVLLSILLVF